MAGARHRASDAERAGHSVDEIIALLKSDGPNQHFTTGGRPGIRTKVTSETTSRTAGAPLDKS